MALRVAGLHAVGFGTMIFQPSLQEEQGRKTVMEAKEEDEDMDGSQGRGEG